MDNGECNKNGVWRCPSMMMMMIAVKVVVDEEQQSNYTIIITMDSTVVEAWSLSFWHADNVYMCVHARSYSCSIRTVDTH